ncbi:MAG: GNAT family N-acetyltransferase [Scrofimicrobium sp.]
MKQASEYPFPKTFETERLILRNWEATDAEDLYRYASDELVGPAAGWPAHKSVSESAQTIRSVLSNSGTYAVTLKETGEPIGSVGLMTAPFGEVGDLELGYWIAAPHWGNRYVGEASSVLIQYAFEQLECPVVWCGAYEDNAKSRRAQEKLGFKFDRVVPGHPVPLLDTTKTLIVTTMTREDWEARSAS